LSSVFGAIQGKINNGDKARKLHAMNWNCIPQPGSGSGSVSDQLRGELAAGGRIDRINRSEFFLLLILRSVC
jgi:hypothetical protein